jgi:hypothetical protein
MKKLTPLTLRLSLLVLLAGTGQADETIGYRIAGDYVEGCACRLICPCDLDAVAMKGCQATCVWHIEKGRQGDVGPDGLLSRKVIPFVRLLAGGLNDGQRKVDADDGNVTLAKHLVCGAIQCEEIAFPIGFGPRTRPVGACDHDPHGVGPPLLTAAPTRATATR